MLAVDRFDVHLMNLTRVEKLGLGALVGLAAHHGLFIHSEWHKQAPAIVLSHSLIFVSSLVVSICCGDFEISAFLQNTALVSISYCVALFTSISVYRLIFHRLTRAGFPGPIYARLTKLSHVWACRKSQNHLFLADLKEKYGDFVRTGNKSRRLHLTGRLINNPGPNEITVFHPDVFRVIDGPKSECIKAEWYDILHPYIALVTSRVKAEHQIRRRKWNRGFTTKGWLQKSLEFDVLIVVPQLWCSMMRECLNTLISLMIVSKPM